MKKIKKLLVLMLIVSCMFANIGSIKAAREVVNNNSIQELINSAPATYNNVDYLTRGEEKITDYLHYFVDGRTGWEPRMKYTGSDKDHIENYVFCLKYHKTAPISSLTYTKTISDPSGVIDEYKAYAYIIEKGFGADHSGLDYEILERDYYITSMAIYQYQAKKGLLDDTSYSSGAKYLNLESFSASPGTAASVKARILKLVEDAIKAVEDGSYNKFIIPYNPSDASYQVITPNITYEYVPKEPEPEPEKPHYCEVIDGTYYGRNGGVVDEYTYKATCESTTTILTKFKISYRDKCTREAMKDVQMNLYRGSSCSGISLENWTTGSPYQINNLPSGQYTVCDAKYGNSLTFDVKETTDLQTFEFTTNPETCEPEVIPDTGVASYTIAGGMLALISGTYLYLRKKGKFIKIK